MIAALLLVAIAVVDLASSVRRRAWAVVLCLAWIAAASAAGVALLGVPPLAVAVIALLCLAWPFVVRTAVGRISSLVALAVLGAAGLLLEGLVDVSSPAAALLSGAPGAPSAAFLVGVLGGAVFLGYGANETCRAVFAWMRIEPVGDADGGAAVGRADAADPGVPRTWALSVLGSRVATVRAVESARRGSTLKGGRLIGPLERALIVVLSLTGAPTLIAAIVAAKGIVRFPEISADRGRGSKAEEFLVGSLVSWACAGVVALLLLALQNS